jgi:hypothetical protein
MSTQQPNRACLVSVDPSTADILRRQTLVVLEANHYYFEDILEFAPRPNTPSRSSTAMPSPSSTPSAGAAPKNP